MKKKFTLFASLIMLIVISCAFQSSLTSAAWTESEDVKIIDHVVYELDEKGKSYTVVDWFDTEEALNTVTEINIAEEIDGIPVAAIKTCFASNYGDFFYIPEEETLKNVTVKEIHIPSSIKNIHNGAFIELDGVKEITVPKTVEFLGEAFVGMDSLQKVTINCDDETLSGFAGCPELSSVIINSDVDAIGSGAFFKCPKVKNLVLPDSVEKINSGAFYGSSVETVSMPVCYVIEEAFRGCKTLKKVTFRGTDSDDLLTFGEWAFDGCSNLKKIVITGTSPECINVCKGAFGDCDKLTDIYFCGSESKWDSVHSMDVKVLSYPITTVEANNMPYVEAKVHFYHKHTHNFTLTVKNATCKKTGLKTYSCICGDEEKVVIKKAEHKFGEWKTTKKATAKVDGTMKRTCKVCGKTESKAVVYGIKPGKTSKIAVTDKNLTVTLNWTEVKGATGYRVYRYDVETGKYKKVKNVENTQITLKNLARGEKYKYAVKAYCVVDGKAHFSSKYATVNFTKAK